MCVCVCVCVRACVREGEREKERDRVTVESAILIAACLQTHTSIITVSHATLFPSRAWTDGKTKELKLAIMERGVPFPTSAGGVRPITIHCASWPIRADCACQKEGLCRKLSVWERRGIMYSIWKIMCFLNIKACQHILLHQIHKIMIFKKVSYDPFNKILWNGKW